MAYTPTDWKDHILSDTYYNITENGDGSCEITPHGEVITQGTPMNAENFNHMEQGIADAHTEISEFETETNTALGSKVDKVTGKQLSTNDYTTEEKNKLAGLANYDDTTVNNSMVRADAADANGQSQLYKTVDGVTTNVDPVCSLATKANQLKLNAASADSNTDRPILCAPAINPATTLVQDVYKASDLTFNASKDELKTGMFKGGINTLVDHEAHNNVNNWRKVCEFSTNGHSNAIGQCALSATILVTDGKYTSPKKGDALLRIVTHKEIKSGALNNIINNFTMDFSTGTVVDNTLSYKDPSLFKLTYMTNGTEITYKLWYYINRTYLSTNFILLSATSAYDTKSIVSEVDLSMGTLSADYMNDSGVMATASVDCTMGVIANDIAGNAATATKLSSAQTVLYESTTATTSFTLSGLFTNWSAVMIYLTGEWVSGTSGTHGFFVPLKHLKDRGTGGIADFCGTKVINFMYTDDDSMRWFERQSQGAMTYSAVKVVGLY